ncbi:AAA family ATPase [bacterium]|nr:AAA family ATPase [bacterium]
MHCHQCGGAVQDGSKFCSNCGAPVSSICPSCKEDNPPASKFCSNCGASLSGPSKVAQPPAPPKAAAPKLDGERRVVAVIFADIVGSTPMAEALDPEEFREVMNQCFHVLTGPIMKYDGMVDKFIGDCIMALFGAPTAHENDPERAVMAALEMQLAASALRETIGIPTTEPIRLRVGINSGMVIAGDVGSQHKRDYTAMGRVVNVAERMQKLCEPGNVTVSDTVYRATRQLFDYEDMGSHPVKGVSRDVHVYRAVAARKCGGSTRGLDEIGFSKFINRKDELESLKRTVDRASSGRASVVAVTGPAGVGKSRLVKECQRITERTGTRWFWARCLEYQRNIPYSPVALLLEQLFDVESKGAEIDSTRLRCFLGDVSEEELARIFDGLKFILQTDDTSSGRDNLEGEQVQRCIYEAVNGVISAALAPGPLSIVIDDLQWCDRASLELFSDILFRFSSAELTLCVTYRQYSRPDWSGLSDAREIPVTLLSERDSKMLVYSILDKANDQEKLKRIRRIVLEQCEGSPLLVEETIKLLMDKGLLVRSAGSWDVHGIPDRKQLPDSLRGLAMARVDQLADVEKLLLQTLSALGTDEPLSVVSKLAGELEIELTKSSLSRLVELQILRERDSGDGPTYSFEGEFFRDAIYESLLKRKRRQLHLDAASFLEESMSPGDRRRAALLSHHFELAGDFEKACGYTKEAAAQATAIYANSDAIHLYERSIELLRKWQDEPDSQEILDLMNNLAMVYYFTGNTKRTIEVLKEQIELAHNANNNLYVARTHNNIGLQQEHEGNWGEARGHFRQAADLAWRIGDKALTGTCLTNLGTLEIRVGSLKAARKSLDEALQIAHNTASPGIKFDSLTNLSLLHLYQCELPRAEALGCEIEEIAVSQGDDYKRAWASRVLGEIRLHQGLLSEAYQMFERYLDLSLKLETSDLQSAAHRFLAEVGGLFRPAEAMVEMLRPALGKAASCNHTEQKLEALGCLSGAFLHGAQFELAGKVAIRLVKQAEDYGHNHLNITGLLSLSEWALATGDLSCAEEQLLKVDHLLKSSGILLHKPTYLRCCARTARLSGRGDDALLLASESVAFCEEMGLRVLLAESLVEKSLVHFDRAEHEICRECCLKGIEVCRGFIFGGGADEGRRSMTWQEEELLIILGQSLCIARQDDLLTEVIAGLSNVASCPTSVIRKVKALCLLDILEGSDQDIEHILECFGAIMGRSRPKDLRDGIQLGLGLTWFARHIAEHVHDHASEDRVKRFEALFSQLA